MAAGSVAAGAATLGGSSLLTHLSQWAWVKGSSYLASLASTKAGALTVELATQVVAPAMALSAMHQSLTNPEFAAQMMNAHCALPPQLSPFNAMSGTLNRWSQSVMAAQRKTILYTRPPAAADSAPVAAKTPAWRATPGRIGQFSRVETPWSRSVWQRSDIDWSLRRPDGLTNLEAASGGLAPLRRVGDGFEGVQLHHLNQRVDGGLAEVWASTHRRVNHNVPPPSWRVTNPDAAAAFRRETPAYWRWRAGQIGGQ